MTFLFFKVAQIRFAPAASKETWEERQLLKLKTVMIGNVLNANPNK